MSLGCTGMDGLSTRVARERGAGSSAGVWEEARALFRALASRTRVLEDEALPRNVACAAARALCPCLLITSGRSHTPAPAPETGQRRNRVGRSECQQPQRTLAPPVAQSRWLVDCELTISGSRPSGLQNGREPKAEMSALERLKEERRQRECTRTRPVTHLVFTWTRSTPAAHPPSPGRS